MTDVAGKPAGGALEPIIEPELPILDAHHHLWFRTEPVLRQIEQATGIVPRALAPTFRRHAKYLFDEYRADLDTGHNVRASVYIDAHLMYRAGGPQQMKSVGEVEFVNGIAAMGASGNFGDIRVCAGIVGGGIDLTLGREVEEALAARVQVGGGRYRGVRAPVSYDADPEIAGGMGRPHVLLDNKFRDGFRYLQPLGLSFDAFILEPQLPELIDLAHAFPETQIILNHLGTPLGVGRYAGRREERFPLWRYNMLTLARCSNVSVKLGGIGMPYAGFAYEVSTAPVTSAQLARDWKPYIETCIEAFSVARCMFESNFPVDSAVCSYPILWNAFKRMTSGASKEEKEALFGATAARVYRLNLT